MNGTTEPLVFDCAGSQLVGVVHLPQKPATRGVLIVVGGPQYRVGSHRQFILLARDLAAAGFAVMRFDHRGTGDSDGPAHDFEHIDADIDAAIGAFRTVCPSLDDIVIWGLCDAASAALFYVHCPNGRHTDLVSGLVLLNPWIRTEQGEARSYLSHYYGQRLLQWSFWKKLFTGKVSVFASLRTFLSRALRAFSSADDSAPTETAAPLPRRMLTAFTGFTGPILLIISGNDLTAAEFEEHARSEHWRNAVERDSVRREYLSDSDHTFSRREWRDRVSEITIDWLRDR